MPVRKYRSVSEMPRADWQARLDPRNLKLACDLSVLAVRLRPRTFPPGLYTHRSVEEASEFRERWERGEWPAPGARR
jgi:hypothetical protein